MPESSLAQETTIQQVRVDGVDLAVQRRGAGAPLVCLHAVGHAAADFADFAQRFAERYEVIAVDWPGHGASGPDPRSPSVLRYAELLTLLLDQLGIERPILLGNSIGGGAAIRYASQRPVRALILCDSAGMFALDWSARLACAAFAALFARGARGASWFPWLYSLYYRRVVLPSPAARARRTEIIAAGPRLAPLLRDAWRSFAQPDADQRAELEALRVPIWFAWAAHDRVIPYGRAKACIARCPGAQRSLFPAGHSAFLECPEAFAAGFERFAASLAPDSTQAGAVLERRAPGVASSHAGAPATAH
jgi:4,5:9,10-diseco-3-hydroxy-5,9,17-trioxoandrosta-1(10),2-diene-4-oate hydrolase